MVVYLSSLKTLIMVNINGRTLCVTFAFINIHEGSLSPILFSLGPGQDQTLIMLDSLNKSE